LQYIQPISPISSCVKPAGNLKKNIKCILFDIYGTLFVSSSGDISISRKKSVKQLQVKNLLEKYKIYSDPNQISSELFYQIEKKHEELRKNGVDFAEVEIDKIWQNVCKDLGADTAKYFAAEYEMIVNPVYPMPFLNQVIDECKSLNLLMGIISNAQFYTKYLFEWFLDRDLQELGFETELIFFSYKLGYAKPSVYLFNLAANKIKDMGIDKNSVLYVGNDMLNDIYPAKKVGFSTALFAGDKRSLRLRNKDVRCKEMKPDIVITDLNQLIYHIKT